MMDIENVLHPSGPIEVKEWNIIRKHYLDEVNNKRSVTVVHVIFRYLQG
jgi:hypothetical protein